MKVQATCDISGLTSTSLFDKDISRQGGGFGFLGRV